MTESQSKLVHKTYLYRSFAVKHRQKHETMGELLKYREYCYNSHILRKNLSKPMMKTMNSLFNGLPSMIERLKIALDTGRIEDVEVEISHLVAKLFDTNSNPESIFAVTSNKRQDREIFVVLGGVKQLLRLFYAPYGNEDARKMSSAVIQRRAEFWNEVLVILREVSFSIPSLADNIFSDKELIFLFTLLYHSSVFDNAINLLEEILASRSETFLLGSIPDLFSLLNKFSVRQLAHFCRALSLLLFEPEDRLIMEGSQNLKSLDLLHLRRDRMVKMASKVEKNQFLVIECPNFITRLVQILRVMNYGPKQSQLLSHNLSMQTPLTSEILHFLTTSTSTPDADWKKLQILDLTVQTYEKEHATSSSNIPEEDNDLQQLIDAFSPMNHEGLDMHSLYRILQMAREIGLTAESMSDHLRTDGYDDRSMFAEIDLISTLWAAGNQRSSSSSHTTASTNSSSTSYKNSRKQLQFYSMMLVPHQIEVLFVLCSLMSGRKKIYMQKTLNRLNIHEIFYKMFYRLSWDAPPFQDSNHVEHIHGPVCECNPESALRIQVLRLIHNFYDRDFMHCENKSLVLTPTERSIINQENIQHRNILFGRRLSSDCSITSKDNGVMSAMIKIFIKEPSDSIYRFWLSSCLEAFLRGNSNSYEQIFIAQEGVMENIVRNIMNIDLRPTFNLQTAFDMLGEIVKFNEVTVLMLERLLKDQELSLFMNVVMNNLVDSNVFVRTLYMTFEYLTERYLTEESIDGDHFNDRDITKPLRSKGIDIDGHLNQSAYLSHSWLSFCPRPASSKAIEIFQSKVKPSANSNRKTKQDLKQKQRVDTVKKDLPPVRNLSSASDKVSYNEIHEASISSFADGIKGAIQGIKDVASQFLPVSIAPPIPEPSRQLSNTSQTYIFRVNHTTSTTNTSDAKSNAFEPSIEDSFIAPVSNNDEMEIITWLSEKKLAGDENDDIAFVTPPDHPKYSRKVSTKKILPKSQIKHSIQSKDSFKSSEDGLSIESSRDLGRFMEPDIDSDRIIHHSELLKQHPPNRNPSVDDNPHRSMLRPDSSDFWTVPRHSRRFAEYLAEQREEILLRLMSTITLRTINHENICCLNTALMILLLGQRRGHLPSMIERIRHLASNIQDDLNAQQIDSGMRKRPISGIESSGTCGYCAGLKQPIVSLEQNQSTNMPPCNCKVNDRKNVESIDRIENGIGLIDMNKSNDSSSTSQGDVIKIAIKPMDSQRNHEDEIEDIRAYKIVKNFRELLWFWQEYYLRRGRDRLSIEFSARIPFQHYAYLVELLCSDDGSSTALLRRPISLPKSPYIPYKAMNKSRID